MDNILYIGPYREFSGAGNASRSYLRSLMQTGHNVSIRPIYNIYKDYPEEFIDDSILELEVNFSKKYHKVIQHCYPHQLCYSSKFDKHIAIVHLESYGYKQNILQFFDMMDQIIIGSSFIKNKLSDNHELSSKILVIPEPIDTLAINNYIESQANIINNQDQANEPDYTFYTIGDWCSKKNITQIIVPFIKLSSRYENIQLVIKTKSNVTLDEANVKSMIEYDLSKIYSLFKSVGFKKPKIGIGDVKNEAIYYIHNNNDCLVNIASGESFGYSTLEAMAFNNNIIANKNTANAEIIENGCGLLVDTETSCCFDDNKLFPIYNTVDQYWQNPISSSIYTMMEFAINETPNQKASRIAAQNNRLKNYSIDRVAELFHNI